MEDILINFGSEIKAVGNGRIEGYLVRFGSADDTDLVGDYFTKSTDFMIAEGARSPIYYNHGLDAKLGKRVLGYGEMKTDDVGVWFSGQLESRDAYEKAVMRLVEAKKAGFSSGTASHLTERTEVTSASGKKSYEVTRWPLGLDASVTPTPCEPSGTQVSGLKSFQATLSELDMLDISEVKAITPSLNSNLNSNLTLSDELDAALAAVETVTDRAKSANDLRIKSGRVLSANSRAKLLSMQTALNDLLASTDPAPAADDVEAPAEAAPSLDARLNAALSAYMDTEVRLSSLNL